jgi:hypothetical protein
MMIEQDTDYLSEATDMVVGALSQCDKDELLSHLLQFVVVESDMKPDHELWEQCVKSIRVPGFIYKVDEQAVGHVLCVAQALWNLLPGVGWDNNKDDVIRLVEDVAGGREYTGMMPH